VRCATAIRSNSNQQISDPICRGATASDYICGLINGTYIDKSSVDGHAVNDPFRTDLDASEGDSGGPYFFGLTIYGVHADSKDGVDPPAAGTSWYTTANRSETEGNFDFCLTSAC
jgi:hypothetical protein